LFFLASAIRKISSNELTWGGLLLAGIWTAVYGLAASQVTFRSLGWLPGREKERFKPRWHHRLFILSVGMFIAISALCSLIGVHWGR
jgi:hypothetical protein